MDASDYPASLISIINTISAGTAEPISECKRVRSLAREGWRSKGRVNEGTGHVCCPAPNDIGRVRIHVGVYR